MGHCNYYLKARFSTADAVTAAEPRLAELLAEGEKASNYWQGSRGILGQIDPNWALPTSKTFWRTFRERFPLTVRYLGGLAGIDDWNDGLAGHLELVDPQNPGRSWQGAMLRREGKLLLLQLNNIWHYSELTLLDQYCLDELGAIGVCHISEQDLDWEERESGKNPFDGIDV